MPIIESYIYECKDCKKAFRRYEDKGDHPLRKCPACGGPIEKVNGGEPEVIVSVDEELVGKYNRRFLEEVSEIEMALLRAVWEDQEQASKGQKKRGREERGVDGGNGDGIVEDVEGNGSKEDSDEVEEDTSIYDILPPKTKQRRRRRKRRRRKRKAIKFL